MAERPAPTPRQRTELALPAACDTPDNAREVGPRRSFMLEYGLASLEQFEKYQARHADTLMLPMSTRLGAPPATEAGQLCTRLPRPPS